MTTTGRTIKIQVKDIPGFDKAKLLEIDGILDTLTSEEADKIISPMIEKEKIIVADCGRLEYMNSSGLANLMRYYIQMKRRNGEFKMVGLNKMLKEIVDISGALKLLEIHNTLDEALKAIKK
ncbi:MAG: STAS domain-containing protein [Candidatus Omnitrophica bacterium]|nr:STAS domain-containing protein [Candidatus Omnitrophota bacterium]